MIDPRPESPQPQSSRSTFLSGREILERSRRSLLAARESLRKTPRDDERTDLFCNSLEALQRDLSMALGRFFETVPGKTSDERSQFTVELPEALQAPPPVTSVDAAAEWSLSLIHGLERRFRALAASAPSARLRDSYESLSELLIGYGKRITRLAEHGRDL